MMFMNKLSRTAPRVSIMIPVFLFAAVLVLPVSASAGEGGEGGDSDSGIMPPGGTLSTVSGTKRNPVTTDDPFAIQLRNVSDQTLFGSIDEEPCDGSQEGDALCAEPRLGGSAGDFQFEPSEGGDVATIRGATASPVTVAKLFYDRTLVQQADGIRIFYQKAFGGPVIRLRTCGDGRRTECYTAMKLASGDQIVKVPFKDDPRITRG